MSKPIIFALVAGMVVAAGVPAMPNSAAAAELLPPPPSPRGPSSRRSLVWPLRLPSRKLRPPQGIAIDLRSWL